MKTNQQLLEDILDSPEAGRLRRSSLEAGLRAVRAKRKRRQTVLCAASVVAVGMMAALLSGIPHRNPSGKDAGPAVAARPISLASRPQPTRVKIITTAELLALFPDRPLALIGSPGRQKLIFLDEPKDSSNF